jgi:hypothetical protein
MRIPLTVGGKYKKYSRFCLYFYTIRPKTDIFNTTFYDMIILSQETGPANRARKQERKNGKQF